MLYAPLYVASYAIANPPIFDWYLVPPMPILMLAFCIGLAPVVNSLPSAASRSFVAVALALALGGLGLWQVRRFIGEPLPSREKAYRESVRRLGATAQDPGVTLGSLEIGVIGYYARARILDLEGLVSPEALRLGKVGALQRFEPNYYIVFDLWRAMDPLHN